MTRSLDPADWPELRRLAHRMLDDASELSRGFRALKVWMTLRTYGADRIGEVAARCCALARGLAAAIDAAPQLERLAPVALNIVCFRYRRGGDTMQAEIAAELQDAGDVVLSMTSIGGQTALRAAIVNHRTRPADVGAIVPAVLDMGAQLRGAADRAAVA